MINVLPIEDVTSNGSKMVTYAADKGYGTTITSNEYPSAVICTNGCCLVKQADKTNVLYKHGSPVNITPNMPYEIEALLDNTSFVSISLVGEAA